MGPLREAERRKIVEDLEIPSNFIPWDHLLSDLLRKRRTRKHQPLYQYEVAESVVLYWMHECVCVFIF